ncbi:hypothetical protein AgCh_016463 [Apium graveolens]
MPGLPTYTQTSEEENRDMNDHKHLSALDATQVAWTLKVRATGMWISTNDRGEVFRNNLTLLDCELYERPSSLVCSGGYSSTLDIEGSSDKNVNIKEWPWGDMDDHQHLSALDATQIAWTLKVRATRMSISRNDGGEVVMHNLIMWDYMDDDQHFSALDATQVAWTLKVRVTRMWISRNGRGEAVRNNLILLDCEMPRLPTYTQTSDKVIEIWMTISIYPLAWTLKVRVTRMSISRNDRREVVMHNLILYGRPSAFVRSGCYLSSLDIEAALRQVKGFSSEWWQLMKISTWFNNYWLSQQHEDDDFFVYDDDDLEDIVDLLPDAIDLGIEKEICNMKTQFEHFIQLSEAEAGNKKLSSSALKESPGSAMSGVLQHQHQSMTTAADMLFNLKELFGDQNRAARKVAMKALMDTQMTKGTPVRDHVLKMMSHLNEIEILGAELDGETQIDIVLMSLPKSFK